MKSDTNFAMFERALLRLWLFCLVFGTSLVSARESENELVEFTSSSDRGDVSARRALSRLNQISFEGYLTVSGRTRVSLTDHSTGRIYWMELKAQSDGLVVESFDPAAREVELSVDGVVVRKGLRSAKIQPLVANAPDKVAVSQLEQLTESFTFDMAVVGETGNQRAREAREKERLRRVRLEKVQGSHANR